MLCTVYSSKCCKIIFQISKEKKFKSNLQDTAFSSVYNASMKIKKLSYIDTSKILYAVMSTNINRDKILMQITHLKITYAIIFHHLQYSSYNDTPNRKAK